MIRGLAVRDSIRRSQEGTETYRIRDSRSRRRWGHGRLAQLATIAWCRAFGHDWGPWNIDDMDGPGEEMEGGGFMPYLSRESRDGEFGLRGCRRRCGTMEARHPLDPPPPPPPGPEQPPRPPLHRPVS